MKLVEFRDLTDEELKIYSYLVFKEDRRLSDISLSEIRKVRRNSPFTKVSETIKYPNINR